MTAEKEDSPLILASASPRRAELLRNAGISFIVLPPHIPEVLRPGESPEQFVRRMAREKAAAIAMQFPGRWVLGADTAVVIGDTILGKPRDVADAIEMLHLLSGHTHEVSTGVALLGPQVEDIRSESTCVSMSALSELEIRAYVESGEPMDKAGAYAIQGIASRWISRLDGCYFNVVGLPVPLVYRMLRAHQIL